MALWPHQHLLQSLELCWNVSSKQQLSLRDIPEELVHLVASDSHRAIPEEHGHLVALYSELQRYRVQLASILRVIRLVTGIYIFGPLTTGFRAYAVQACFCDEMLDSYHSKQFAASVINDISVQLSSCDAALRNIEACLSFLPASRLATPAPAKARHNTGNSVVCPMRPCMQFDHNLKRPMPSKRHRSTSTLGFTARRRRYYSMSVIAGRAALHDASHCCTIGRSRFPFNSGITLPRTPADQLRLQADNNLGNPKLCRAGGPDDCCQSSGLSLLANAGGRIPNPMVNAIGCLRHLAVSSAPPSSKDATAADVPSSSRCASTACDAPTTIASAADMNTGARDGSSNFTRPSSTTDAS